MIYVFNCPFENCRSYLKTILADREQIEAHLKSHDSAELHKIAHELGIIDNDGFYYSKSYLATRIFEYLMNKQHVGESAQ